MPKFKKGDKIKFRSNAEDICKNQIGKVWQSCWVECRSSVGEISSYHGEIGPAKVNINFSYPTMTSTRKMWVYERTIQHVDDECLTNPTEIHALLDRLIKGAG